MPLETGGSRAAFSRNVATEMHAGKPQKQAVAIAYAQKRRGDNMDTKIDAVADSLRRAADGVDALEKRMVRGDGVSDKQNFIFKRKQRIADAKAELKELERGPEKERDVRSIKILKDRIAEAEDEIKRA